MKEELQITKPKVPIMRCKFPPSRIAIGWIKEIGILLDSQYFFLFDSGGPKIENSEDEDVDVDDEDVDDDDEDEDNLDDDEDDDEDEEGDNELTESDEEVHSIHHHHSQRLHARQHQHHHHHHHHQLKKPLAEQSLPNLLLRLVAETMSMAKQANVICRQ